MDPVDTLLKKAQKFLQSAAVLLELEDFDSCGSRAYFAMFYSAYALLLREGHSVSGARGVRSGFTQAFVENHRFPERARIAFEQGAVFQEMGDYSPDFAVSREEAEMMLQESEAFVNSIARHIEVYV